MRLAWLAGLVGTLWFPERGWGAGLHHSDLQCGSLPCTCASVSPGGQ